MRQGVQEINFSRLPFFACVVFGLNKLKHPLWAKNVEYGKRGKELAKTVIVPSAFLGARRALSLLINASS